MTQITHAPGNTQTGARRGRRWCITLNNYSEHEYSALLDYCKNNCQYYILAKEIGEESKIPHIQGYLEYKNARTFNSIKKINTRLHLDKARAKRKQNIEYCMKDNDYVSTFPEDRITRMLKDYNGIKWKSWQLEVLNILKTKPDNRKIYWYWEPIGDVGKSFLCKYLCLTENVIIGDGNKTDMFNQINNWLKNNPDDDPTILLYDIPRTAENYVSYTAVEKIKNGFFYSGKYEGGVCIFPNPHVICFANFEPQYNKLSRDRWEVRYVGE